MSSATLIDLDSEFDLDIHIASPDALDTEPTAWWCTHPYSCRWTKCCSGSESPEGDPTALGR
ncbi:hypothetical protein AB0I10_03420 [Streptomyces sp. NPDC050636]|uniref:hypothetical protein n=1 Tax=Streptomyces sp. NPDC050636 TaxID=3154510 RepID=UPI0034332169